MPASVPAPPKGARVNVPLGSRTVTGCVVVADMAVTDADPTAIKDVVAVLDDEPFLPSDIVDLALWVGEYYACGPGDVLTMAMPPSARRGEATSFRTAPRASLTDAGRQATPRGSGSARSWRRWPRAPEPIAISVARRPWDSRRRVRRAAAAGLVTITDARGGAGSVCGRRGRMDRRRPAQAPARELTDEQPAALARSDRRGRDARVPCGPAPRRDRQRQDRGLPAPRARRHGRRPARARARARRSR